MKRAKVPAKHCKYFINVPPKAKNPCEYRIQDIYTYMYCSTVLKWKVYASESRNDQTRAWCSLCFWHTSTCMYMFFRRVWQHYLAQLGLLFQLRTVHSRQTKCLTHTMWKTINTSDGWTPRLYYSIKMPSVRHRDISWLLHSLNVMTNSASSCMCILSVAVDSGSNSGEYEQP